MFKGSWKTTSMGVLAIAGSLVHLFFNRESITEAMVMETVTAILVGIGLMFSRDNNKSSEEVGVK